jgi:hypothetical protein
MMGNDRVFFGTILAMFALMCGHPIIALIIFIIAIA